jgi:hypothetical protein
MLPDVTIARRLTVIALYLTMIAFAVVALAAARPGLSAEPQAITRYTMTVEVDNKSFLSVVQTVTYQAETEITSLVFNVPPAAAEFNAFTLSSASIAETSVTPAQDGVLLELPLPKPVQAGEMVSATLRWWGQLPPSNGRYGTADGVQVLGNWYPMLATMRNGVWERHQYTQIGDAYFSAVADYDVTVSAPQNVTIAASGSLVATKGRGSCKPARHGTLPWSFPAAFRP